MESSSVHTINVESCPEVQKNLMDREAWWGYSPRSHKTLATTEDMCTHCPAIGIPPHRKWRDGCLHYCPLCDFQPGSTTVVVGFF